MIWDLNHYLITQTTGTYGKGLLLEVIIMDANFNLVQSDWQCKTSLNYLPYQYSTIVVRSDGMFSER